MIPAIDILFSDGSIFEISQKPFAPFVLFDGKSFRLDFLRRDGHDVGHKDVLIGRTPFTPAIYAGSDLEG